jgi:hypothetical protein
MQIDGFQGMEMGEGRNMKKLLHGNRFLGIT